jgi:AsmA protein
VQGKQPVISMNERLSGVQVGPLLKDMLGEDRLTGTTQASAKLTTTGQTPDEFKKTLNGNLAFSFTEGAVKGFNLAAMIRKAQAQLNGQPVPAETGPDQTDFSELSGTATVTNGVISNQDLMAKSPLLRVEGEGKVNLPQETLDYLVTAKVVGSLEGQGGKGLADLQGIAIPVQLSGTFAKPEYKIRLDQALKESAEKKVKKKLEKELEKELGDKLGDQLGDQLKGIFGR